MQGERQIEYLFFWYKRQSSKSIIVEINPSQDHPLIKLAQVLPWQELSAMILEDLRETTLMKLLNTGRKLKLRIHLGVYLLQQMKDLTDRETEWQLQDNAAYQIFAA